MVAPETASEPRESSNADPSSRASIGTTLYLLALAWGAAVAAFPLTDNSFLTHLATGRLILDEGAVPGADPYTFTARGVDWTVQSWLPSVIYASAERVGGVVGLRVVVLLLFLASAALLWRLSRPCVSLVPRLAIVFGSLYVVTNLWGERPYMVGVIGLGLVWLTLDRSLPPWALVPTFWVWANSHGSFPLGIVLVLAVLVGRHLDGEGTTHERRVLAWSAAGVVSSVIGPLGLDSLLFPLTALQRSDLLTEIVEWQPPTYQSADQRVYLVLVIATLLALVRRPTWAMALPAVAFVAAAMVAQRNIVMAVMVLVPVCAACVPAFGTLTTRSRPALIRPYVGVGVLALVASIVYSVASPFGELDAYPTRPLAWLESSAIADEHVATADIVGNLLTNLDGDDAAVFVDDRVDMLPEALVRDSLTLLRGGISWAGVLDDYGIEVVVWARDRPLHQLLVADDRWQIVLSDTAWSLACRRGPTCEAID